MSECSCKYWLFSDFEIYYFYISSAGERGFMMENKMEERNWKYKINGGWPTLIMASVMLAIFGGITVWLYTTRNGAFIGGLIVTACMAIGFILSVCSVLFFKVFVDKDGFFCQTAPGNGRYYRYSEIRNMWLSSGRETNARQPTYCNFETVEGKRMRFLVLGSQIDAVDYMIERVESMGNKSGEDDLDWEIVITGKKEAGFVVIDYACRNGDVVFGVESAADSHCSSRYS